MIYVLSFFKKIKCKMKTTRQLNIKDGVGYFFSDMINIDEFDPSLLNIDEVSFRNNAS